MTEIDLEALRAAIAQELGDDEVWHLVCTFRAYGGGGEVTIEVWGHPEHGYSVRSRDEAGRTAQSNLETDSVLAVQVGHLGRFITGPGVGDEPPFERGLADAPRHPEEPR